jgi:hypothetical protein
MEEKVTVGVFWICDTEGKMGVVYDKEEYDADWTSELGDEFIMYEKAHEEIWPTLSARAFGGKYAGFAFDDFPRGRITFDKDEGVYVIDYDVKIRPKLPAIRRKIYELFGLEKAFWQPATYLQSKTGIFNK